MLFYESSYDKPPLETFLFKWYALSCVCPKNHFCVSSAPYGYVGHSDDLLNSTKYTNYAANTSSNCVVVRQNNTHHISNSQKTAKTKVTVAKDTKSNRANVGLLVELCTCAYSSRHISLFGTHQARQYIMSGMYHIYVARIRA